MITPENGAQYITNRYWRPQTFFGLSTDTKPTDNIVNGSVFIEMDTATLCISSTRRMQSGMPVGEAAAA